MAGQPHVRMPFHPFFDDVPECQTDQDEYQCQYTVGDHLITARLLFRTRTENLRVHLVAHFGHQLFRRDVNVDHRLIHNLAQLHRHHMRKPFAIRLHLGGLRNILVDFNPLGRQFAVVVHISVFLEQNGTYVLGHAVIDHGLDADLLCLFTGNEFDILPCRLLPLRRRSAVDAEIMSGDKAFDLKTGAGRKYRQAPLGEIDIGRLAEGHNHHCRFKALSAGVFSRTAGNSIIDSVPDALRRKIVFFSADGADGGSGALHFRRNIKLSVIVFFQAPQPWLAGKFAKKLKCRHAAILVRSQSPLDVLDVRQALMTDRAFLLVGGKLLLIVRGVHQDNAIFFIDEATRLDLDEFSAIRTFFVTADDLSSA